MNVLIGDVLFTPFTPKQNSALSAAPLSAAQYWFYANISATTSLVDGHFSNGAIVPAWAQLDWVLKLLAESFDSPTNVYRYKITRCKFIDRIPAPLTVSLMIVPSKTKERQGVFTIATWAPEFFTERTESIFTSGVYHF